MTTGLRAWGERTLPDPRDPPRRPLLVAFAARWAVEQQLRFGNCGLAIESLHLRAWEQRRKLLELVDLNYTFLVELLGEGTGVLASEVLGWAHRPGCQARGAWRSLYCLRAGRAALWNGDTPNFQGLIP